MPAWPQTNAGVPSLAPWAVPTTPRKADALAITGGALILASSAMQVIGYAWERVDPPVPRALSLVMGLLALAGMVGIVLFCMGLYRLTDNVRRVQPQVGVKPGWAVGSLFIPFVQFVAPGLEFHKAVHADKGPGRAQAAWSALFALALAFSLVFVGIGVYRTMQATRGCDPLRDTPVYHDCVRSKEIQVNKDLAPLTLTNASLWLVDAIALVVFLVQWCQHQRATMFGGPGKASAS